MELMKKLKQIYENKRILITGHTGFKGSWLAIYLRALGAEVIGYGLDPYTIKDNFVVTGLSDKIIDIRGDIRDKQKLMEVFNAYSPEYVFHLAAQPLVRESYTQPVYTYETNVMGTINVLECMRETESIKMGIFITTDKCYKNNEQLWGYRETDALGGYDPYSSSKAACEIAVESWKKSFFEERGIGIATVRAGNVIGGGDWAKDRLIPDCIRALEKNKSIRIRSPHAIRPWQHVLEALQGYLILGEKLINDPKGYSEAWNFGPNLDSCITVGRICENIVSKYGVGEVVWDVVEGQLHEATVLRLDNSKVQLKLGWQPKMHIEEAIDLTIEWYKNYQNKDVYALCLGQIKRLFE